MPYVLIAQPHLDSVKLSKAIDEVIITGQYGENSLTKSVYKVRLIDQKRIQLQGAYNLKDVLANELNVRVNNDPALGGSVSIQGISGQNVKIMVDGVPIIGREGGFIDLNQINLNNIERIELVEGPMSVNFGTDALGGVINLISKKPTNSTVRAGVNAYYETIGQYNVGSSVGFTHKKWSSDININRNFFDGYALDPNARKQLWKPRTQYFGDIAVGKSIKEGNVRYNLNVFDEKVTDRDSAHINPYYAYGDDKYFYSRRITNSLFFEKKLNAIYGLNIIASYNTYRRVSNTWRKDLVSLEQTLVPSESEHDTNYFSMAMSRGTLSKSKANAPFNYQVGYELNHETAEGRRIAEGNQSIADANLFGSAEWKPMDRLNIRPGLRLIYNSKFNAPIIPSINIKWELSPIVVLRMSYGKGFRAPSLKELYLDFVDPNHNVKGNINLDAETQNNYQASMSFEWKKIEHIFTVEPTLFYNHIANKIDLVLVNPALLEAQYNNIASFKNVGATINTAYKAPRYSFVLGYSYMGINNSLTASATNSRFYYTSEFRSNANYEFNKMGLTLALFYKYNGRIQNFVYDINTGQIKPGFIDAYGLLDASLTKAMFNKRVRLTMGSKNLLNIINVAANIPSGVHSQGGNSASIAMGRTFFVSFNYVISKIKSE